MKKHIVIIYIICWAMLAIFIYSNGVSLELLLTKDVLIVIHVLFLVIVLPFLLVRYLYRAYRQKQFLKAIKKVSLRIFAPIVLLILVFKGIVAYNQAEDFDYTWDESVENTKEVAEDRFQQDQQIRGMSVYALGRDTELSLEGMIASNVEWLAVHPYMSQVNETSSIMSVPEAIGEWSQRDSIFLKEIAKAQRKHFKILLKPHLFLSDGWRSTIDFQSKEMQKTWYENYRTNMLHYAHMAAEAEVAMFCIGTELESALQNKDFWMGLIHDIRQVYSGKLIYAANWDDTSLQTFPEFWAALDYIGIQAYYPLTKEKSPSLENIKAGWGTHIETLAKIKEQHNKPIVFTELGYRADAYATVEPWAWDSFWSRLYKKRSERMRMLAYEAFFQKVWHQEWFAGVFVWQWNRSLEFSVQGKPAQNIIATWFAKTAQ